MVRRGGDQALDGAVVVCDWWSWWMACWLAKHGMPLFRQPWIRVHHNIAEFISVWVCWCAQGFGHICIHRVFKIICLHIHTHTYTYIHTESENTGSVLRVNLFTYTHTYIHTYIHRVFKIICLHIHTYTYTHVYTYIQKAKTQDQSCELICANYVSSKHFFPPVKTPFPPNIQYGANYF